MVETVSLVGRRRTHMINKDFLKEVLTESKQLLSLDQVKWVEVPKYEELSVNNIMTMFEDDNTFQSYFPSKLPKGRAADRSYTYNVLH